jgi:hypothetical protein
MSAFRAVQLSKKDQHARTPAAILDYVRSITGARRLHDPCPANPKEDGLVSDWSGVNFVNPPFEQARTWLEKGLSEFRKHGRRSVFLLPARTHTRYFADLVFPECSALVFVQSPVFFEGYRTPFPTPLCLIAFGDCTIRGTVPRLPYGHVYCGAGDVYEDVFPKLRKMYMGDENRHFPEEHLNSKDPSFLAKATRPQLVCAMGRPGDHLREIAKRHEEQPGFYTVVLVQARFDAGYFKKHVVPHAKHLLFIGPSLTFDRQWRSYIGSVAVCFGDCPLAFSNTCRFVGL